MTARRTDAPSPTALSRALNTTIERPYWLPSLEVQYAHKRRHDDTDGERGPEQDLRVTFGRDGDAWVQAGGGQILRFRTGAGGGQSLRVRQALLVLAEAILRDNEERPQG